MIEIGKEFSTELLINRKIIKDFSVFSGDSNPIHLDEKKAKNFGFNKPVAHGAILIAIISKMIGKQIPGPGALWLSQDISWLSPVYVNDFLKLTIKIIHFSKASKILTLRTEAFKDNNLKVMRGEAKVKINETIKKEKTNTILVKSKKIKKINKKPQILITGGTGELGSKVAKKLIKSGFNLILTYNKNKSKALELRKEFHDKFKSSCTIMRLDLSKNYDDDINKLSKLNITALIHCATNRIKEINIKDIDSKLFYEDWVVSCKSSLDIITQILPNMINNKFGRFIFFGTSAIKDEAPKGWTSYLMNKHSLWGLVRNLSQELASDGITTNMISPSLIDSELTENISDRIKELTALKNPLGRLATGKDVANIVNFLLQEESEYVNGQNLFLTGG